MIKDYKDELEFNDEEMDELEELDNLFEEARETPKLWLIPKEELDGKQNEILKDETNNFFVKGPAGSGKTIVAVHKLVQLIADGEINDTLMVVYTHSLKQFIKIGLINTLNQYGTEEIGADIENMNIYNSDSKELYKRIEEGGFRNVIIDEAQDMASSEIIQLTHNSNNIMIFGDDKQKLYEKGTNLKEIKKLLWKDNINQYIIEKHYRIPETIAKFASKITNDKELVKMCMNHNVSYKPTVVKCENLDEEIENVIDIVNKLELKNVGIFVNNRENAEYVEAYFERKNFKCEAKIDDNAKSLNFNNTNKPKLLVYHSSKGLEFENVFVLGCGNGEKFVYATEHNDEYYYKNALYVCCTRPSERLFVSYVDELNEFMININNKHYKYEVFR